MKPVRQIVLARQNIDCLKVQDVDNLINVSMGTALHDSVEAAWKDKDQAVKAMVMLGINETIAADLWDKTSFEQRLEKEVGGWIVTGKYDIVTDGMIGDVKSSSVYGYMLGSSDWQYKMQMSIYRWLDPVLITEDIGTNFYIFTDWSRVKALQDTRYPQSRIAVKEHALVPVSEIDKYVKDKLALVDKYMGETNQDNIPECTQEELWMDPPKYAYFKNPASNRATKLYDHHSDAHEHYERDGRVGKVEERKGLARACQYCNVANICEQRKKLQVLGLLA